MDPELFSEPALLSFGNCGDFTDVCGDFSTLLLDFISLEFPALSRLPDLGIWFLAALLIIARLLLSEKVPP